MSAVVLALLALLVRPTLCAPISAFLGACVGRTA